MEGEEGLADVLGISELRDVLGRGSPRRERVSRQYAYVISRDKTFPAPVVDLPSGRAWRRADVEAWMDAHRPGWRDS